MAEFTKMCQKNYGLKRKPNTNRNPQPNTIIERIHKTIRNIIRKFEVSNIINNNSWSGILSTTKFAVRAAYHTTLKESPIQLVLFRDAIFNIKHVSNWEHIQQHKQEQINRNNRRENMRCNNHQYKVSDKILVKGKKNSKHEL